MTKIVLKTVPWIYVISDLRSEKIIETFFDEELQKSLDKKVI